MLQFKHIIEDNHSTSSFMAKVKSNRYQTKTYIPNAKVLKIEYQAIITYQVPTEQSEPNQFKLKDKVIFHTNFKEQEIEQNNSYSADTILLQNAKEFTITKINDNSTYDILRQLPKSHIALFSIKAEHLSPSTMHHNKKQR